jgi:flavin reductase (DIM6/NTAB) family NADH-FMN oxidoreductase RutF
MEATPRIELGMEVLQTSALPLGYVAPFPSRFYDPGVTEDFRDALSRLASGVVVVSARAERFHGLTASSLVSVSLNPPLILVGLEHETATLAAVRQTRRFSVSVLAREQEFIAERFAGRAPAVDPEWRAVPHRLGANGVPLIEGCAAWLECEVEDLRPAGDHDVCIGRVAHAVLGSGDPLIFWDRRFWTLR